MITSDLNPPSLPQPPRITTQALRRRVADLFSHTATKAARLHAFVVMPDYIHLLLTPTATLERPIQLIKGRFSHRLASNFPIGHRSFIDQRIRDREDFKTRPHYILQNPVRAHLTD